MSVINQSIVTAVIKSFDKGAKALDKIRIDQDKAIQCALDAMLIACDKPKANRSVPASLVSTSVVIVTSKALLIS